MKVVKEMKKAGVKVLRNDEWQIEDELVLKERKVYVLKNESKIRDYLTSLQYTDRKTQKTMKDSRIGYQELLVARSY